MAENCSILDPRLYEPWMTEAFARDNAVLTRALQISISSSTTTSSTTTATKSPDTVSAATSSNPFHHHQHYQPPIASDLRRSLLPNGRVSKRKPRASKRSQTTFINTDAENFREMVQKVTGGRFANEVDSGFEPVLRPEPVRANRAAQLPSVCLPTLDTSAFLLDRGVVEPGLSGSFGCGVDVDESGFDFDALLPSFPTLESWGVM